ncbi:MAG: hypothetical protein HMLKMBBP_03499 [Planctomycetes bacterium]|nr:hypothetical protein [Planctomycetota bacterium]MCG3135743.1 hypothetical protein [Planctomycetota bacterium]
MVIPVADNQWFLRQGSGSTSVTTDPIPLGDNDRATAILVVHDIFGGALATDREIAFKGQVSKRVVLMRASTGWTAGRSARRTRCRTRRSR